MGLGGTKAAMHYASLKTYCSLIDGIKLSMYILTEKEIEPGTQLNTHRILICIHSIDKRHA